MGLASTEQPREDGNMDYEQAERLRDELVRITLNPEVHDQEVWVEAKTDPRKLGDLSACGTTGCLAGNAVVSAGLQLEWTAKESYDAIQARYVSTGTYQAVHCRDTDGTVKSIATKARELFGLSYEEADLMFSPYNSVPELWRLAIEFSNGQISYQDALAAYETRAQRVEAKVRAISGIVEG